MSLTGARSSWRTCTTDAQKKFRTTWFSCSACVDSALLQLSRTFDTCVQPNCACAQVNTCTDPTGRPVTKMAEGKAPLSPRSSSPELQPSPKRRKTTAPLTPSQLCRSEPTTNITVEGLLVNVSPIKNRRFVGELVDATDRIPIVGFDPSKQRALFTTCKSPKKSVNLANCNLQLNKYTQKPELLVQRHTRISESTTEFEVDNPAAVGAKSIFLDQRTTLNDGDKVNVRVKVIRIFDKKTGRNLTKQEIIIADKTDAVLTLWEDDMDSLELDESYSFTKLTVRVFDDDHILSYRKFGGSMSLIEDIGDVMEDITDPDEPSIEGVTIAGVKGLFSFKTCLSCKDKISLTRNIRDDDVITCEACNIAQTYTNASHQMLAKLLLLDPSLTPITLVAYKDMLMNILVTTSTDDITQQALLKVTPFNVTYDKFHKITSISR